MELAGTELEAAASCSVVDTAPGRTAVAAEQSKASAVDTYSAELEEPCAARTAADNLETSPLTDDASACGKT